MHPIKLEINRPLSNAERNNRLIQKLKKKNPLNHNLSVICLNSTYLETVDKYYSGRGWITFACLFLLSLVTAAVISRFNFIFSYFGLSALAIGLYTLILFYFIKDSFNYAYAPIRFNRKTQMVHVFMRNGKVLSAPWKDIFFCITSYSPALMAVNELDIKGHILDESGKKVLNSFELSVHDVSEDDLLSHWEFIRRYMEDGVDEVKSTVDFCLPVEGRWAGFKFEFQYCIAYSTWCGMSFWGNILTLPYLLPKGLFRSIFMITSRRPKWPDEIEKVCEVDINDPVNLTAKDNLPWTWKSGWFRKNYLGKVIRTESV